MTNTIVKNYSTTIPAERTIMEIESLLVMFGVKGVFKEYQGTRISALSFYLEHKGQKIPFKLPVSLEKSRQIIVKAVNSKKLPQRYLQEPLRSEQADRVVWRIIKDWLHSQLSLIEINYADAIEILLPYAYNVVENKTMYEKFIEKKEQFLALENKEDVQ